MQSGFGVFLDDFRVCPPPTVLITLSQYVFGIGQTGIVKFSFSRVPIGFDMGDIEAENGILSNFRVTSNPLIYEAIFTPMANIFDETNVISVGTGWTDRMANGPIGPTFSNNYIVNTLIPITHIIRVTTDGIVRGISGGYIRIVTEE